MLFQIGDLHMIKAILILLLSFGHILSMEQPPQSPQKGKKRPAQQISEPSSKAQTVLPKTAFELLPDEIKNHVLSFLTTAKGATKRARLDNAAENIRSFFRINTQFKYLGDDNQFIDYIITQLANNYADGDKLAAAEALGTEAAGVWLRSILSSSDPKNETEKYKIAMKLGSHFIDAAKEGRINVIKFLLEFGPEKFNLPWYEALKNAIKNDKTEMVLFLLPQVVVPHNMVANILNKKDATGETMLFDVVENQNARLVDLLLAAGAQVNISDRFHLSPLHVAVDKNNLAIVQKLLSAGVRPFFLNLIEYGTAMTPLMRAVEKGNLEIIKALLAAGANPNIHNEEGETALSEAEENANIKNKEAIIKLLKEHGAR